MACDLLKRLGAGGFGCVYRYDTRKAAGIVARKVFANDIDGKFNEHERNILTHLGKHQNIIRYIGHGLIQPGFFEIPAGIPFIDFAFYEGVTVHALVNVCDEARKWLVASSDLCDIVQGLLDGLEFVHDKGVIHLDLKPANIIVVRSPSTIYNRVGLRPIILDFGIAARVSSTSRLEMHYGTAPYQAPEWWDDKTLTTAYDVWGLGIVFHELIYGERAIIDREELHRLQRGFDTNANQFVDGEECGSATRRARRERVKQAEQRFHDRMKLLSKKLEIPTRRNRLCFEIPHDVKALALIMTMPLAQRPSIKEIQASGMFRSIHEGTLEQLKYAKLRAQQTTGHLEDENRQLRIQIVDLQRTQGVIPAVASNATVERPADRLMNELAYHRTLLAQAEEANLDYSKQLDAVKKQLQEQIGERAKQETERSILEADWQSQKATLTAEQNRLQGELEALRGMFRQEQKSNMELEYKLKEAQVNSGAVQQKDRLIDQLTRELAEMRASSRQSYPRSVSRYSDDNSTIINSTATSNNSNTPAQPARVVDSGFAYDPEPQRVSSILTRALHASDMSRALFGGGEETSNAATSRTPIPSSLHTPVLQRSSYSFAAPALPAIQTATKRKRLDFEHISEELATAINAVRVPTGLDIKTAWQALNWACGVVLHGGNINDKKPEKIKKMVLDKKLTEVDGDETNRSSVFEDWLVAAISAMSAIDDRVSHRVFNCVTGRSIVVFVAISKRLQL